MMKRQYSIQGIPLVGLLVILLAIHMPVYPQTPTAGDCLGAIPVCQDVYYEPLIFSGPGNYPNEIPHCSPSFCTTCCPNNCLDGEWNSAWYLFTVQQSGLLRFTIQPDVTSDDYDWAVFNLTENRCEEIYSMVNALQVSCNAAGISNTTGMSSLFGGTTHCNVCGTSGTNKWNADLTVFEGQTFVLYVSNWGSGAQGGFTLDFSASTAVIYDDVPPSIASVAAEEITGCNETELTIFFSENVTCAGVSPFLFTIEGPGGPYQVVEVYGPACGVGGEWEKEFILTVDKPFASNGMYTLYMATGFPGVQDVCNNIAPADTISFFLDLGAPEIDQSGLQITDATCGLNNGAVTGLTASGLTSLSYVWTNSQGNVAGNLIDLVDVPSEHYTLEVYDLNNCIATAGPFFVDELGVPEIDDEGVVIIPSNYGAGNGSISGIVVNSNFSITQYIWEDDQGNTVGSQLDLTGVPTGYYELTVIDENTCEAYAGPYFVGEIGGPLTANPSASPSVICRGEETTLFAGAGGGSGSYEYSWTSTPEGFTSTLENPVVSPQQNTTYHVEVSDGYITDSASVAVYVNQLPLPDAGADHSIPHGTSTTLHGSVTGGSGNYAYSWSPADKLVDPEVAEPQTKNLYETTLFQLMVTDLETSCLSETPGQVVVNITGGILSANPEPFPDSVFCIGETFWLHANAGGGSGSYTYTWTSDPPMTLPSAPSFSLSLPEDGIWYFYVKVDDGFNEVPGYTSVRIHPAPLIDLGNPVQTFCPYDTITLDAGNHGSTYLWSNGDTSRCIKVGTTGLGYDVQTISVQVTNPQGCRADTSVTIVFDHEACLGTGEMAANMPVRVYPNPATAKVMIEAETDGMAVTLQLLDITGKLQRHKLLRPGYDGMVRQALDLTGMPPGLYILKLNTSKAFYVGEIMKQ
jgi:hypothetical protein